MELFFPVPTVSCWYEKSFLMSNLKRLATAWLVKKILSSRAIVGVDRVCALWRSSGLCEEEPWIE